MVSFKGFCQFPGYADGNIRIQRRQSLHGFDDAMGGFIAFFFPDLTGRKPPKKNASVGSPDPTNAVTTADGPGRTVKLTPFSLRV